MAKKHNATGRSTAKLAPFAPVERYVIDSLAFREASLPVRAALLEFYYAYNGSNNGEIRMGSRRLAGRLNVSHGSAAVYIRELDDYGFIEATHIGGFARRNKKESEYRLTMFVCNKTGQRASKRFLTHVPSLSSQLDRTVKPARQSQQNCSLRSSTLDRNAKIAPAVGPASYTHLDITIGHADKQKHSATVAPFRKAPEVEAFPEMPAFLVRTPTAVPA
jgi:hypothetical protein